VTRTGVGADRRTIKRTLLVLTAVLFSTPGFCQTAKPRKANACNKAMTFCWYGPYADGSDEVEAWGNHWSTDDSSETLLEVDTEVRCVKRLHICLKAGSQKVLGQTVNKVDILPVTRWDSEQITADGEGNSSEPCERDTFIVSRVDGSVLMISAPGPRADSSGCRGLLGKPKTVTYKLTQ
jgi:hypothetical protein